MLTIKVAVEMADDTLEFSLDCGDRHRTSTSSLRMAWIDVKPVRMVSSSVSAGNKGMKSTVVNAAIE